MEVHAIERRLTGYVLTSGEIEAIETRPVDPATMLSTSVATNVTVDRQWIRMKGEQAPEFAKRFPVTFRSGDRIHVLTMTRGVTAKPNRPAYVRNERTDADHVENLSPAPTGVIGTLFGPAFKWLVALVVALVVACLERRYTSQSEISRNVEWMFVVIVMFLGTIWSAMMWTETAYALRARARRREEMSAVAEAKDLIERMKGEANA